MAAKAGPRSNSKARAVSKARAAAKVRAPRPAPNGRGTPRKLWGGETDKAVGNFPISGQVVPMPVVHWLARIKGASAAVNAELGLLPKATAGRIERAAKEIAAGQHDGQFPIDVFQTGSGTSTNTNANEVIATLAGSGRTPTTTSTWASPPTTCSPRRSTWRRSIRLRTSCCRR